MFASSLCDYVITEAGFGADLGAEKFLHIKCRQSGVRPWCAVLVATIRAIKMHGSGQLDVGFDNVRRHVENMGKFGIPCLIGLNQFADDTKEDIAKVKELCNKHGLRLASGTHFADGGEGAREIANGVIDMCADELPPKLNYLYDLEDTYMSKIEKVAKEIYRAGNVEFSPDALRKIEEFAQAGFLNLPVCIAKTQYSFSDDAKLINAPTGHTLHVKDVRMSKGAGFLVVLTGSIMTMPGFTKSPAAERISIHHSTGQIEGLH